MHKPSEDVIGKSKMQQKLHIDGSDAGEPPEEHITLEDQDSVVEERIINSHEQPSIAFI